jgi:hypothetical protein
MEAVESGSRGEDECRQLKERLHSFMGSMRHFISGGTVNILLMFTQNNAVQQFCINDIYIFDIK